MGWLEDMGDWWDETVGQDGVWGDVVGWTDQNIVNPAKEYLNPSKYAAEELKKSGEAALAETRARYEEGKGYVSPYYKQGLEDYQNLGNMIRSGAFDYREPGYTDPQFNFQADPGYAFRQEEGRKMIAGRGSAAGNMLSGATMKAMQRYGQDLAAQEYQNAYNRFAQNRNYLRDKYERDRDFGSGEMTNRFNRYAQLGNVGYGAATQLGNMAIGQGTDVSNILGELGNVAAASRIGKREDLNRNLSDLAKLYNFFKQGKNDASAFISPVGGLD